MLAALGLGACTTAGSVQSAADGRPTTESADFIVTTARAGDTTTELARRFLGDAALAWMIEDYNDVTTLAAGQTVIVPRKPWNSSGVYPDGYQLVPVLTYHDIGPQAKGRLVIGAQDCHAAESGAHTGCVSVAMIKEAGARLVICGHSERRAEQ